MFTRLLESILQALCWESTLRTRSQLSDLCTLFGGDRFRVY